MKKILTHRQFKKVLFLRQDRIGDVLISTPTIKILKEKFVDVRFDILLSKYNVSAKGSLGNLVNKFWVYDKSFLSTLKLLFFLKKEKYDLIIDLMDKPSRTSKFIISILKPKYCVGLDNGGDIYTHPIQPLVRTEFHIVERTAQLLLAFGIVPAEQNLELSYYLNSELIDEAKKLLGNKQKKYRLGINLMGSNITRFWGEENHIALFKMIKENNLDVECILFSVPKNEENARNIARQGNCRIAPLSSSLDLFVAMLKTCDIILTPDTSAVHISSALKIPCICLFEQSFWEHHGVNWTPYNCPYKELSTSTGSMKNIPVSDVFQAISEFAV